jgi:hypothetical protein
MLVLDSENWKHFVATVTHCERPSLFSGLASFYLDVAADVAADVSFIFSDTTRVRGLQIIYNHH